MRVTHRTFLVCATVVGSLALAACSFDTGSQGTLGGPSTASSGDPAAADPAGADAAATPTNGGAGAHDSGAKGDSGSTSTDAGGADAGTTPPPGFDTFQQHNLDAVNQYRATKGIAPLVLDLTISKFALAGTTELMQDHSPHAHFIAASNAGTIWSSGFAKSAAENQGDPNGWYRLASDPAQNELLQIDAIQKAMFDEGPGAGEAHGHYTNMMNPALKKLGVGLVMVNGALYLTNDFSG